MRNLVYLIPMVVALFGCGFAPVETPEGSKGELQVNTAWGDGKYTFVRSPEQKPSQNACAFVVIGGKDPSSVTLTDSGVHLVNDNSQAENAQLRTQGISNTQPDFKGELEEAESLLKFEQEEYEQSTHNQTKEKTNIHDNTHNQTKEKTNIHDNTHNQTKEKTNIHDNTHNQIKQKNNVHEKKEYHDKNASIDKLIEEDEIKIASTPDETPQWVFDLHSWAKLEGEGEYIYFVVFSGRQALADREISIDICRRNAYVAIANFVAQKVTEKLTSSRHIYGEQELRTAKEHVRLLCGSTTGVKIASVQQVASYEEKIQRTTATRDKILFLERWELYRCSLPLIESLIEENISLYEGQYSAG